MINRDYILRIIERFGRALARILFLRQANQPADALAYIDELCLQNLGLSSNFLNSITEEMLMGLVSSMGEVNIEKALLTGLLFKAEGDIYGDLQKPEESSTRYLKSLNLFLAGLQSEKAIKESGYYEEVTELLIHLSPYDLPSRTLGQLVPFFEKSGEYARAEDTLFEAIEAENASPDLYEQGVAFYQRLLQKTDDQLSDGNFSREEVSEGLTQLRLKQAD